MAITRQDLIDSPEWMLLAEGITADAWERIGTETIEVDPEGRISKHRPDGSRFLYDREHERLFALNDRFDFDVALAEFEEIVIGTLSAARMAEVRLHQQSKRPQPAGRERTTL